MFTNFTHKFNATTSKNTNQKAEIFNTSLSMLDNNPINTSSCILQVVWTFLLIMDTLYLVVSIQPWDPLLINYLIIIQISINLFFP